MNKIIEIKFGSHLYGTDTPTSDLDLKGLYLPTAREICLGSYKKSIATVRPKQAFERNNKDDVDIEIFSLDRYLELLLEGQTLALDMLFAPLASYTMIVPGPEGQLLAEIYNNRFELLNKNVNAFIGYAKQQAAKYGQKGFRVHALRETLALLDGYSDHQTLEECFGSSLQTWINRIKNEHIAITQCRGPNGTVALHLEVCGKKYPMHGTIKYVKAQLQRRFDEYGKRALMAEKNEGLDYKALSHAIRVNSEAKELLETGIITFPRPDRDLLLKVKLGQMPYAEIAKIIEEGLEQLTISQQKSSLRETPNNEWADNFIYEIYSDIVKNA